MKPFLITSLCFLWLATNAPAAAGDLDLTFDAGSALDRTANTIAVQPDGKILIGGSFKTVPGLVRHGIARLNPNGSGDPSFNPGAGAEELVWSIVLQPDGKILVGGWFTNFNGTSHNRIIRLNADGSVDAAFQAGSGANESVFAVALQPDGKILVGGYFTSFGGFNRSYLTRLNADGSVDPGFNPAANDYVYALHVQPDGKIVVAGLFTSLAGTNINRIARLNPDGSLDTSFNPGTGVNYFGVTSLARQADGRFLIGGYFSTVNGQRHDCITRLNADGSVDPSFTAAANGEVGTIVVQADGKILIGGQFFVVNGKFINTLARLLPDGSLDNAFNLQPFYAQGVSVIAIEPQGSILLSGGIYSVNGLGPKILVRLNADGSVNGNLNAGNGIGGYGVFSGTVQPDGKILVAGNFADVNNHLRQGIARFESDGRLDESFDPGPILNTAYYSLSNPVVYSVALQPDGKIIIGGGFTNINGTSRNCIARLNPGGSVDASFDPGAGADYSVYRVVLQTDGKVLISGGFIQVDGRPRDSFARLNHDGSLDESFNPDIGFPFDAAVQPDGRIVVVGYAITNGTLDNFVLRLNSNGSVDPGFSRVTTDPFVTSVALQADGKILVGGNFTSLNGINRRGLARLNSDGSLDPGYDPKPATGGTPSLIRSFLLQPDGKLLISGEFTDPFNNLQGTIARLNPDGTRDDTFAPCSVLGFTWPIALQPDSKVVIGGSFSTANGVPRLNLARLLGDWPIIITQPAGRTNVVGTAATFTVNAAGAPVLSYQWYRDGIPLTDSSQILGTTTATLTLKHAGFRDAATYTVVVSNDAGSVTSEPARLRVIVPSAARR